MFGKSIIKWVILIANLLAVGLLFIGLLGSVLNPNVLVFPAYITLFYPLVLATNLFFIFFWIILRKWMFLISLSALLLIAVQIKENFPVHWAKISNNQELQHTFMYRDSIKILTYNTCMSGKLRKHTKQKPNKVMQYVLDSDADIVCMQEFMVSNDSQYLTHEDMLRIFAKYPYKHIDYKLKLKTKKIGIATLSKYPIVNKRRIVFNSSANLSIYSDIDIHGNIVRLVNNHLESNRITENDKSLPNKLRDNFDANNLTDITLHFSKKLSQAYKLRANQARTVAKVISESPYKVIVCGDLNDVPTSFAYTQIKGNLSDVFSETSTGLGWTFYQHSYGFRIDYVFYDHHFFLANRYEMDKVDYSDHYPVICQLLIK